MNLQNLGKKRIEQLIKKWLELEKIPNIFAYQLNIKESKYLKGFHNIYTELNPERMCLRRTPQIISSLKPTFNEEKFNFKKISLQEVLMIIPYELSDISIIINKSPLTKYHALICPEINNNLPQSITLKALKFCVEWMKSLEGNQNFRIGYNSPGALASVNHLHLHLVYIEKDLYIDRVKLKPLRNADIFCTSDEMPTKVICWLFKKLDSTETIDRKVAEIYEFLQWMCLQNMPHNLFLTPERLQDQTMLKMFIYARDKFCVNKDLNTFNIGFCELSGFVTVGDKQLYDQLTEQQVFDRINEETGNAFRKIYDYFL